MARRKKHKQPVMGHTLPAPHMTASGRWWIIRNIGLPLIGLLLALDILLWAFFHFALGRCYGLLCLF